MRTTVGGLRCGLVFMVAHPSFPVDRPCDRQAPRATLPHFGVTFMGKTSCAFSKGITLSSSLIGTHAPNPFPSPDFGFALIREVSAGSPSPCYVKAPPNAVSVVLLCVPRPDLRRGNARLSLAVVGALWQGRDVLHGEIAVADGNR